MARIPEREFKHYIPYQDHDWKRDSRPPPKYWGIDKKGNVLYFLEKRK